MQISLFLSLSDQYFTQIIVLAISLSLIIKKKQISFISGDLISKICILIFVCSI